LRISETGSIITIDTTDPKYTFEELPFETSKNPNVIKKESKISEEELLEQR
jgi:hypothetical protein